MSQVLETDHLFVLEKFGIYCSFVTVSNFLGVFIIGLVLHFSPKGQREASPFIKTMILLEILEALPESAILVEFILSQEILWSFLLSLFFFNVISSMIITIDFLETRLIPLLHRTMICLILFSIGTNTYTISVQSYSSFKRRTESIEKWIMTLGFLIGGTMLGILIVFTGLILENLSHKSENPKIDQILADLKKLRTDNQQMIKEQESTQDHEQATSDLENTDLSKDEMTQYATQRQSLFVKRKIELETLLDISTTASLTNTDIYRSQIFNDFTDVVQELVVDRHTVLYNTADSSLCHKFCRLFVLYFVINISVLLLTGLFVVLLSYLKWFGHDWIINLEAFIEGFVGGGFLSSVYSTLVPRLHYDSYRAMWTSNRTKIVGTVFFQLGFLFAMMIDMLTTL